MDTFLNYSKIIKNIMEQQQNGTPVQRMDSSFDANVDTNRRLNYESEQSERQKPGKNDKNLEVILRRGTIEFMNQNESLTSTPAHKRRYSEELKDLSIDDIETPRLAMTKSTLRSVENIKKKKTLNDSRDECMVEDTPKVTPYKDVYMEKFGIELMIPNLYVQDTAWYDSTCFLQVVNYIVPNEDLEVHSHFLNNTTEISTYREVFHDKIQGCTIRLVKVAQDLNSISVVDKHVFHNLDYCNFRFSQNPKLLVLFSKTDNVIRLFNSENPETIIEEIRQDNYIIKYKDKNDIQDIMIDNQNTFLIVRYTQSFMIFNIQQMIQKKNLYVPTAFILPQDKFDRICHFHFVNINSSEYLCYVAAKLTNQKKIKIFELHQEHIDFGQNVINYFGDLDEKFQLKFQISQNIITTIFINGSEKFKICMDLENNEITQANLRQIGSKKVQYIYKDKIHSSFLIFACDDFDEYLHLFKSSDFEFHQRIKRKILPKVIKIFNVIEHCGKIQILSLLDDEFIIDQVSSKSHQKHGILNKTIQKMQFQAQKSIQKLKYVYSPIRAFSCNWPYVAFSGLLENYVIIVNVYDEKTVQRVQMSKDSDSILICETFITNTKDLFCVIKRENQYEILMLDLDKINVQENTEIEADAFHFEKITSYTNSEVGHRNFNSIFVRGSSRKERIETNQKLVIFLMHEDQIFYWSEGMESIANMEENKKIISDSFSIQDANTIYYCQKSRNTLMSLSEVIKIEIGYNDFEQTVILSENSDQFDFIDFKIDRAQNMLVLVSQDITLDCSDGKICLKIFDLNQKSKAIFDSEIFDPYLMGTLKSGNYVLVDGHLYCKNVVIKFRYDLMKKHELSESEYFNQYSDVLSLSAEDIIKTNTPLDSFQSHKFAFIILNNNFHGPKKILLVPYLHERKIYLNRIKHNTKYFYTSVNYGHGLTNFFAINLTESKYYVYSQKGILKNRMTFGDLIQKYGEIKSVSQNGLNIAIYDKSQDVVTVVRFSEKKIYTIKRVKVAKSIVEFVKRANNENYINLQPDHWFCKKNKMKTHTFLLSNNCNLLVKISRKNDNDEIFYFHAGFKFQLIDDIDPKFIEESRQSFKKQGHEGSQNLFIFNKKRNLNFSMDQERLFLWSNHKIYFYYFNEAFKPQNQRMLGFKIAKSLKFDFIKKVEAGENSDQIAIVVEQMHGSIVISWSKTDDQEINAFEVEKNHEIIWDQTGKFLILTDDQTTLPIQNCNLKCFQLNQISELQNTVLNDQLGYQKGYRFDSQQHNWILMREYLCLSFSYMTFVIQHQVEQMEVDESNLGEVPCLNQAFDLEGFTYIINKKTCFTSQSSELKLQGVLKNLVNNGVVYLELLHYSSVEEDEKESALGIAVSSKNIRVIDLILSHMAKIKVNDSQDFKEIISELTDVQSFSTYLENLTTQTQQMRDKKVLRVKHPLNDNIIAIASSQTTFIDDKFYNSSFGERLNDDSYNSYPVEIVSLSINWIVSTPEGKNFLQAIHESERLDFYEIRSLQIIIEFLYQKIKKVMLCYLMPLFLIQGVFFFFTMLVNELNADMLDGDERELKWLTFLVVIVNQSITIIMVCIMIKVFSLQGKKFFYRVYTWFDIIFYVLNTIANQFILDGKAESIKVQRIICSFAVLFFLAKTFYFMKLIDQIAPLVDIIIRVFIDIRWFMFVYLLSIAAFGMSFSLLGKNQIQFDELSDFEISKIKYADNVSAFIYLWDLTINGGDTSTFQYGEASQKVYLLILNISGQFILVIHLLNMLIAIMGDTFGKRNEVAEQVKIMDHLSFVMDNWYLKDFALGNLNKIQYIITAFNNEEESHEHEMLNSLEKSIDELQELTEQHHNDIDEILKRQTKQELMIQQVLKNQEIIMNNSKN